MNFLRLRSVRLAVMRQWYTDTVAALCQWIEENQFGPKRRESVGAAASE